MLITAAVGKIEKDVNLQNDFADRRVATAPKSALLGYRAKQRSCAVEIRPPGRILQYQKHKFSQCLPKSQFHELLRCT
jgi:hypothetical protein